MSATVEIAGERATIQDYEWTGSDRIVPILNSLLDPLGPAGSDPAPDFHAAQQAVDTFGGEIVDFELPEVVEGRVY